MDLKPKRHKVTVSLPVDLFETLKKHVKMGRGSGQLGRFLSLGAELMLAGLGHISNSNTADKIRDSLDKQEAKDFAKRLRWIAEVMDGP